MNKLLYLLAFTLSFSPLFARDGLTDLLSLSRRLEQALFQRDKANAKIYGEQISEMFLNGRTTKATPIYQGTKLGYNESERTEIQAYTYGFRKAKAGEEEQLLNVLNILNLAGSIYEDIKINIIKVEKTVVLGKGVSDQDIITHREKAIQISNEVKMPNYYAQVILADVSNTVEEPYTQSAYTGVVKVDNWEQFKLLNISTKEDLNKKFSWINFDTSKTAIRSNKLISDTKIAEKLRNRSQEKTFGNNNSSATTIFNPQNTSQKKEEKVRLKFMKELIRKIHLSSNSFNYDNINAKQLEELLNQETGDLIHFTEFLKKIKIISDHIFNEDILNLLNELDNFSDDDSMIKNNISPVFKNNFFHYLRNYRLKKKIKNNFL